MHMSPLTAAEAVSAGLITGARWRHDAMNFLTHFPDAQQPSIMYNMFLDRSAWQAACVSDTVGELVTKTQAHAEADGQLHNGVRADGTSMNGGTFNQWLCWVHQFCENTGVTQSESPSLLRVGDYIAYMQHASDAEESAQAEASALQREPYGARIKRRVLAGSASGAAEEAKNSHASPLTSELVTMAAKSGMVNKSQVRVITASGIFGLS